MSNTVTHSPSLRIPVAVFLTAVVLVPLVYRLHVSRPPPATLPDLLTAVHDKRPDWRPVRISASARDG
jgi:hypothetical protein